MRARRGGFYATIQEQPEYDEPYEEPDYYEDDVPEEFADWADPVAQEASDVVCHVPNCTLPRCLAARARADAQAYLTRQAQRNAQASRIRASMPLDDDALLALLNEEVAIEARTGPAG